MDNKELDNKADELCEETQNKMDYIKSNGYVASKIDHGTKDRIKELKINIDREFKRVQE